MPPVGLLHFISTGNYIPGYRISAALILSLIGHILLVNAGWHWHPSPPVVGGEIRELTIQMYAPAVTPTAPSKPEQDLSSSTMVAEEKKAPEKIEPVPLPEENHPVISKEKYAPEADQAPQPMADSENPVEGVINRAKSSIEEQIPPAAENEPPFPGVTQLARPLYQANKPPEYPARARRRQYEGLVELDVRVNADGKVGELRVKQGSGHDMLDAAAIEAVRDWTFIPGTRNNTPVELWVTVPVRFELR